MDPIIIAAITAAASVAVTLGVLWLRRRRRDAEACVALLAELERGPGNVFELVRRAGAGGRPVDPSVAVIAIRGLYRAGVVEHVGVDWPSGPIYALRLE